MDNLPDIQNDSITEILRDPLGLTSTLRLDRAIREGRAKLSRVNLRAHQRRLKALLAREASPRKGRRKVNRTHDWKRSDEVYAKGGAKLLHYLRYRFENNKKHGKTKGEWKLTADELDIIFNSQVKSNNRLVSLVTFGNRTMLKRIDPDGDYEMSNIVLVARAKRHRLGADDSSRRRDVARRNGRELGTKIPKGILFSGPKYLRKMERLRQLNA